MKNIYKLTFLLFIGIVIGNCSFAQKIAAGGWHSIVVCEDSTVKAFGENATGQLGNGNDVDQSNPVSVTGLTGIIAVSAGGDQLEAHSMALKADGTVWAWGSNLYGALGNATTTSSSAPVQSLLLDNIIAISAGGWHSTALKKDGTVWTWGWNKDGQLGDNSTTDKIIAGKVPNLTNITAIAAGTYHVLALKNDGTVWAWGDNVSGQIGNGTTGTDAKTPTQVSNLTNVVKIAAGRFFSLAIKSDGTVWTWGENLYGQLGNGTNTDSNVPVQVKGLTGITSALAATGAFHCIVVKNDNTVWAWGRNTYGNLGDNSVTHRSVPVQMIDIADVSSLAAGTNFSILTKTDGSFWGCGRNASGQLGDGTFLQRNLLTKSTGVCKINAPLGIEDSFISNIQGITTYPNPSSSGFFQIDLSKIPPNNTDITFEIYDVLGHKKMQFTVNANDKITTIDLSAYPKGIYYLSTAVGNNRISQKLIIQ
jgi:alpha-tubulin suppressor-like RCC1 family protein